MRAIALALFFTLTAGAAEPPRLTASPSIAAAASMDAAPLSVGKFLFVSVSNYDGPITWDWSAGSAVRAFAVKPGETYPGFREGDTHAGAHAAPTGKSEVLMVFGEQPGTVTVAAWGVVDGKPKKLASLAIAVGVVKPQPMPEPKPEPEPKPKPYVGKWRILIVEETAQAAANRGEYLTDPALLDYVREKCSAKIRVVDQDVVGPDGKPPKDLQPWLARAKGKKLPHWYVVGDDGTILAEGDLPPTPQAALDALKKIGG